MGDKCERSVIFLHVALVHFWSADPYAQLKKYGFRPQAVRAVEANLFDEGMLDADGKGTDKLRFWVDHLLAQPFPIETYKMPGATNGV